MSTLTTESLRALLPPPNTAPPKEEAPAGAIPATGANDALIFDPDENITYDPLQRLNVTPQIPAPQSGMATSIETRPPPAATNTIDLAADDTTSKAATSGGGGMFVWVALVAVLMIISFVIFFLVRGNSLGSSAAQQATPAGRFDAVYR